MIPSSNPDWFQAKENLKKSMQEEISTMREILSNILQEEVALLDHNKTCWKDLMQSRFYMVEKVKFVRKDRIEATQKLISLSDEKTFNNVIMDSEEGCEISFLLDQLIALSDKINYQNIRNQVLLENVEHFLAIPNHINYPPHLHTSCLGKSRKNFLMTIP